jgi:hypothetical protein
MGVTLVLENRAESSKNRALSKKPKGNTLKYGIIYIATRLFLAMSKPVTQFSSMTISRNCWTGSKYANLNVTPTLRIYISFKGRS